MSPLLIQASYLDVLLLLLNMALLELKRISFKKAFELNTASVHLFFNYQHYLIYIYIQFTTNIQFTIFFDR